jgi:poly-beta-1,6-N-acetyl-D-glucosamine synthase
MMHALWLVIFWCAAMLLGLAYVGYPILAFLLARLRPRPVKRSEIRPRVSLIIAAYNEERTIRGKLENSLALTYPRELLDLVVVADGSTDATAEIVREYSEAGIRLLFEPERRGKTAAISRAATTSDSDILLFSDANTVYQPDLVQSLVANFADPEVGGVSGRKVVLDDVSRAASEGESFYWSFESQLKVWESTAGSIVTADGEVFAMRRELFAAPPGSMVHDDMYLTLQIIQQGRRVVFEPSATSAEFASRTVQDEFHLKVRYASAGYQIISAFPAIFRPPRSLFAWQFLAHKLTRWLVPFFLIGVLVSSFMLPDALYRAAFWAQCAFYVLAAAGGLAGPRVKVLVLYIPWYFVAMNAAFLRGFVRYFAGGQTALWRKAAR